MSEFGDLYQKLKANNAFVLFNKSSCNSSTTSSLFSNGQNDASTPITEDDLQALEVQKKNEEYRYLSDESLKKPYSNYTDEEKLFILATKKPTKLSRCRVPSMNTLMIEKIPEKLKRVE